MDKVLLVVDDCPDNVEIVSGVLSDLFNRILSASTVKEAQNLLEKNVFEFIILDINLDGRNGAEVIKFIENTQDNPNKNIPILIVSGIINSNFISRNEGRFTGILQKPFEHNDLRKIVEDTIRDEEPESLFTLDGTAANEIFYPECELPFPIVELQQRVNKIMAETKKNAKLKPLFSQIKVNRSEDYVKLHIGMLINISTAICIHMQWSTDKTLEKFIYASYLHDMALSNRPDLAKINSLEELEGLKDVLSDDDYKLVFEHPRISARVIKKFSEIPLDVATIIKQHHELPSGAGYPGRHAQNKITPLSTVFIVAHNLMEYILLNPKWRMSDYIKIAQVKLKGPHFNKVLISLSSIK